MPYRMYFLSIILVVLFLPGCADDDNPMTSDEPKDPGAPPLVEGSYHPLSIGSYWKYTGGDVHTRTVTGGTMIDGKYFFTTEYIQPGNPTSQFEYMREDAQTVYALAPTFAPEIVPVLKYDVPSGTTWTFTRTIKSTTNYYTYTIIAKDLTRTVLGKTYNDVLYLQARNFILTDSGDTLSLFSPSDVYYARGVGAIEYRVDIVGTTYLQEYYIKK